MKHRTFKQIVSIILNNGTLWFLPTKTFLKLKYRIITGKKLNLDNPQSFNEKLQWLKLNDRQPIYTTLVDKYEVKKHVANLIGEEYIIPTLGIYDKFDDINFDKLPNQFVIKCTHDSGGLVVCKNKLKLDINAAKKKINKSMKRKYYYSGREWPYKNVKPRIIIEKYMEDNETNELRDYKFYVFSGKCNYVMLCMDRESKNTKFYYFDKKWNLMKNMSNDGKKINDKNINIKKPNNLSEMFKIAEKLSKGIKFVRLDLYNVNGKIYFGEYTFYPSGGLDTTRTEECNKILNEYLIIKE